MKKLSAENIKFIDNYLTKYNVKFIDVRLELTDHLATEFEESSQNLLLVDFLRSKRLFIDSFIKTRQKTIHWSYQKGLWKRFIMFFYKPSYILISLILLGLIYLSISRFSGIIVKSEFIGSLFLLNFLPYFFHLKRGVVFKKIQSSASVLAIMSLPSTFLYIMPLVNGFLFSNHYLFFGYWFLGMIFNIAGLLEVYYREKELLQKYNSLIKD